MVAPETSREDSTQMIKRVLSFLRHLRLWRPFDTSFCTNVKVVGPDKLEHRIIFNGPVSFANKFVPIDELREEDLDLLEGKIETNTHPLSRRKGNVGSFVSRLHCICIPSARIKSLRVVPQFWTVMNVMQRRNDHSLLRQSVPAREDHINLGSPTRLEGRVVSTLGLLDILVKELKAVGDIRSDLCVLVDTVVDQLLQQSFLHTGIADQAVDQPREK